MVSLLSLNKWCCGDECRESVRCLQRNGELCVAPWERAMLGWDQIKRFFSLLSSTARSFLLLLNACFADTVLTGAIKLHSPETEKCALVLQVIGCKSVDCDGLCITALGQLWEGLVMAFSSLLWLAGSQGKETLNSGKKHITLHHIWTWKILNGAHVSQ